MTEYREKPECGQELYSVTDHKTRSHQESDGLHQYVCPWPLSVWVVAVLFIFGRKHIEGERNWQYSAGKGLNGLVVG